MDDSVRQVVLDAGGIPLSALVAGPAGRPPKATVVALHGAGLSAGYFHGPADPGQSLLTLGAALGYQVLAIDRPGYRMSAAGLPKGQLLAEQAATLRAALAFVTAGYPVGAGLFLLGHSYGGKLALAIAAAEHEEHAADAADRDVGLLGLDVSGVGHRYAVELAAVAGYPDRRDWPIHWGPLSLYPPGTFRLAAPLVSEVPPLERDEAVTWPDRFPGIAARVRVPVRFTFAEHERWWQHDAESLAELSELLSAPRVLIDRLPHAGHNVSLGLAARAYHLRALAFFDECLTSCALRPA